MMSSLPLTSPLSSALPGPSASAPAHGGQGANPAPSAFAKALDEAKAPPDAAAPAAPHAATAAPAPSERPAPAQRRAVPPRQSANDAATARGHRLDAKGGEGAAAARLRSAQLAARETGKPQPLPGVKPDPQPMPAEAEGPQPAKAKDPMPAESEGSRPNEDSAQRHAHEPTRPFAPPDCVAGLVAQIQAQLPPTPSTPAAVQTPNAPQPAALVAARPTAASTAAAGPDLASPMPVQNLIRAGAVATAAAANEPSTAQPARTAQTMAEARPSAANLAATAPGAALLPAAVLGTPSAAPVEGGSTAKASPGLTPAGLAPAALAPAGPAPAVARPAAVMPTPGAERSGASGGPEAPTARPREALQVPPEPAMSSSSAAQQARPPAAVRAEAAAAPDAVPTLARSSGPAASDGERRAARATEAMGDLPQPVVVPAATAPPAQLAGSGAATQARLSARPDSPDFAPQLGAQITTFVRDGIEHAQLHLNPAEMGPVSVQIQLDGQIAQVHLSADHALTRQALEASMPQLASQLSEAGLTLGGGGVFEQPRQGREAPAQDGRGDEGRSGGSADARPRGIGSVAPVQPPMRRGVVDLVA